MITKLTLKKFTAFNELELNFSPKINVIIGENGTGKTHVLKAAYALCAAATSATNAPDSVTKEDIKTVLTSKLLRLFMPMDNKLGKMRRHGVAENASISASFSQDSTITGSFHTNSRVLKIDQINQINDLIHEAVFIPTKEVLSLVKGLSSSTGNQEFIESIFDDGYLDLVKALRRKSFDDQDKKVNLDPRFNSIVPKLTNLIEGRYRLQDDMFCFETGKYEEKKDPNRSKSKAAQMYSDSTISKFIASKDPSFSCGMTAEGFRKIGILQRLLSNGTLNPGVGGPLFWDEPESNMNPLLMKMLVEVLLVLARNGQQIILATHDYVLLKWFDLLMDEGKDDHVRYHTLNRNNGVVVSETVDSYQSVSKSAISNAYAELYDADVKRALG